MEYIILNWMFSKATVAIVTNNDGTTLCFGSAKAASNYAKDELNGHWKVVAIEE